MTVVAHLMASPFLGGPERQMLGLAAHLPGDYRSVFLSFAEGGRCQALLDEAREQGHEAIALRENAPRVWRAAREVAGHLGRLRADVVCCSGYKPDVIGWLAARQAGVPVVAVAHGWTAATLKVRLNESLDRLIMRWMDRVVCVSERQAIRARRAGVPASRVAVIRNAIRVRDDAHPDPARRSDLHALFATPRRRVVGAAGRLSPEKGFAQLVHAAKLVEREDPDVGFVVFGDGPLRGRLAAQIEALGLARTVVLAGFRPDLHRLLPHLDLLALPSYTEGLPVIVLEALAAGVPVVATAVGGTPEVVEHGVSGYLVPPGDPPALARAILDALRREPERQAMGARGRQAIQERFTVEAQGRQYQRLFEALVGPGSRRPNDDRRAPGLDGASMRAPGVS